MNSLFHKDQAIRCFYQSLKFAYHTERFARKNSPISPKTRCDIKKRPSSCMCMRECKTYAMDYVTGSSTSLFSKVSKRKSQQYTCRPGFLQGTTLPEKHKRSPLARPHRIFSARLYQQQRRQSLSCSVPIFYKLGVMLQGLKCPYLPTPCFISSLKQIPL